MKSEQMSILLVEDDVRECDIYKKISDKRKDFNLVAITNSSTKAIEYFKEHKPEAVILDLELTDGEGSGFDFIESINKLNVDRMPIIIVTTNVYSDSVYDFCHNNKIDFIFYKKQRTYSQEKVIDTLFLLRGYEPSNNITISSTDKTDDTDKDREEKALENIIMDKINKELELIGVSPHLQGKKYLCDAIYFVITNNNTDSRISVIQFLVGKYKKSNSTISRAMQNAILHAWRVSALEDLTTYYTARINYETGVPTPMELVYYYADKIKKQL